MGKPKISLSFKAFIAVVVILLPILVIFTFSYYSNKERLKDHIQKDLTIISEVFEGQIYQFLELSKSRTQDFSSDGFIISETQNILKGKSPAALNQHLTANKLPLDKYIHSIDITDKSGLVIASSNKQNIGKNYPRNEIKGPVISEIFINGLPELAISAPLINKKSGEFIGLITKYIHIKALDDVISGEFHKELGALSWNKGKRDTLEAYIVNKDKLMLTQSRFIENAVSKKIPVDTLPVNACMDSHKETIGFYKDYRGVSVAGSAMCIPQLSWTVIVEMDEYEALAPITKMRTNALVTAFIVACLLGLLFIVFFRNIVLQLRTVSSAARKISGGDYKVSIPENSSDEIGALSAAFNNMASDINAREIELQVSEQKYRSLISNIPDVVWTSDSAGNTSFISQNVTEIFGHTPEEIYNSKELWIDNIHPEDIISVMRAYNDLFTENKRFDVEYRLKRKDGQWIWVHDRATATYYKDTVKYADGVFTDITVSKHALEALKQSEERLSRAQQIARLGSWDWDIANNKLFWSDEIYRIFGLKPQEFGATYESFLKSVHPDDREFVKSSVENTFSKMTPYSIDHRIVLPSGIERYVHEEADVMLDEIGNPIRMVGTVQDITENKTAEFELKKLSMAIEHSVNIVFITDVKGTIEYVNPKFEEVTGYTKEDAIGQTPRILASGEVPNQRYEELWKTILSGKTFRSTIKNRKKSGGYYWCNAVISPISNDRGEITHFLAVQEDITEKMSSEEKIKYLADYDSLTGLVNRSKFIELLDSLIENSISPISNGIMFMIDMDQFKFLNDTYGHGVGDEYLYRLSKLLKQKIETISDESSLNLITRLSGDEFAIFLPFIEEKDGFEIADQFRKLVSDFRIPEVPLTCTASIGMVSFPEHGANPSELLTKADAAMYRAKEFGRNRVHGYRPEDKDLEKMLSRLSWKEKILKALEEDRFIPWFQPILDLKDNKIHHYEVLARLKDESGNILLPGAFIDIAERFGLIGSIDRVITEKAMRAQAEMLSQGSVLSFGMNLSGKDLGDEDLLTFLQTKIQETGADPNHLIFEITETAAIADLEGAKKFIKDLKALGCHFSLDDFGVGFTSFTYLKEMQVDYIKIDGSFIRKLHENPNDQIFVKAMTDVAKGLKIKSIAEFIEEENTLDILRDFGVDYGQGYLIGKPAPELVSEDIFIEKSKKYKVSAKK
ncbi:MAG: EAL domain-containing protein [Deltaproteobacteria bacterium]|nr:EAL domain-containing protein [Deltaproteobacteria bacterium]